MTKQAYLLLDLTAYERRYSKVQQSSRAYQERVASYWNTIAKQLLRSYRLALPTISQFYHSQLTQLSTYLFFAIPYVLILPVNYNTLIYYANLAILSEKNGVKSQKSSINALKTKYIEYICIQREEKQANEQRKPNNTLSGR